MILSSRMCGPKQLARQWMGQSESSDSLPSCKYLAIIMCLTVVYVGLWHMSFSAIECRRGKRRGHPSNVQIDMPIQWSPMNSCREVLHAWSKVAIPKPFEPLTVVLRKIDIWPFLAGVADHLWSNPGYIRSASTSMYLVASIYGSVQDRVASYGCL